MDPEISYQAFKRTAAADYAAVVNAKCEAEQLRIQKIEDYINSADLFILCWSNNAAKSDYVQKERNQALDRAYPKVKPYEKAPLSICPLSIEPRAEIPEDMKSIYNFEQI